MTSTEGLPFPVVMSETNARETAARLCNSLFDQPRTWSIQLTFTEKFWLYIQVRTLQWRAMLTSWPKAC